MDQIRDVCDGQMTHRHEHSLGVGVHRTRKLQAYLSGLCGDMAAAIMRTLMLMAASG